jgi:hypothetical protein
MNIRALFKYVIDINSYNLLVSIFIGTITSALHGVISFFSIGVLIGYLVHWYFKKNEYYLYYNLGYTKLKLLRIVFTLNIIICVIMSSFIYLISF